MLRIPGRDVPYVPVISLSWYNDKIEVKFLCPALCTVSNTICTWRLFDQVVVIGMTCCDMFVVIYRMSNGMLRVRKVTGRRARACSHTTLPASICPIQRNLCKHARYFVEILPSFVTLSFRYSTCTTSITSVFASIPYPP